MLRISCVDSTKEKTQCYHARAPPGSIQVASQQDGSNSPQPPAEQPVEDKAVGAAIEKAEEYLKRRKGPELGIAHQRKAAVCQWIPEKKAALPGIISNDSMELDKLTVRVPDARNFPFNELMIQ